MLLGGSLGLRVSVLWSVLMILMTRILHNSFGSTYSYICTVQEIGMEECRWYFFRTPCPIEGDEGIRIPCGAQQA